MKNRLARVQELIRAELGAILTREVEFTAKLVTIQMVSVTPDLRMCHVHVGVIGSLEERKAALTKLEDSRIALQAALARRVKLKYTPHLLFHLTDAIEKGVHVVGLIDQLDIPPAPPGEEDPSLFEVPAPAYRDPLADDPEADEPEWGSRKRRRASDRR